MAVCSSAPPLINLVLLTLLISTVAAQSQIQADADSLMLFLNQTLPHASASTIISSSNPCNWDGVACTGPHPWDRIQSVQLEGRGLRGSIPEGSIGKLSSLTRLLLAGNSLEGAIPADVWKLPNIVHFNASRNHLGGGLPPQLDGMRHLQTLDLSQNQMTGIIQSSIGQLSNLSLLNLGGNAFLGGVPAAISNCHQLQFLDLSANNLNGSLPLELGYLPQLKYVNLSSNLLEGRIPEMLGRLHYLQTLDLSRNSLAGLSLSFSTLRSLTTLLLSDNQLTGIIPASIFYPPFLETISLKNNRFAGSIPVPYNRTSLRVVDFGGNKLDGMVSSEFWIISTLEVIKLPGNALTGSLPGALGEKVVYLDLANNGFTGSLPSLIHGDGGWSRLQYLDLSSNKLVGMAAPTLEGVVSLRHLNLARNILTEWPIPGNALFPQLDYLNLSSCRLNESIPTSVCSLKQLVAIDLSHNLLPGAIPVCFSNLSSLTSLDLSYNTLTGTIPPGLGSLPSLRHMNASFNRLRGRIPSGPWDAQSFLGDGGLCGSPLQQPCTKASSRYHPSAVVITAMAVGGALIASASMAAIVFLVRKTPLRRRHPPKEEKYFSMSGPFSSEIEPSVWASGIRDPSAIPVAMLEKPLTNLTLQDVLQATSNFTKETQISDGGYGPVFRGVLPGEFHVAVKILPAKATSNEAEAAAELETLGRLKHPNLVPLLGYCLVGIERVLLYTFMDNGDLYHRLHDLPAGAGTPNPEDWSHDTWEQSENDIAGELLPWTIRHKIALGTARALAFLHHGCNPPIIHGDVRSTNVHLDSEYEPHLADCGLAALMPPDGPAIGGSIGYAAPEHDQTGETTTKGDVYGFGAVLLELVTGKRAAGDSYQDAGNSVTLVSWVRTLVREKRSIKALDPTIVDRSPVSEMLETVRIAYLCTADLPSKRPTIQQVVGLLKDVRKDVRNNP